MDKKDIIEALVSHYSGGNKRQFAAKLGCTPQTISTWISRNTFDIDLVFAKCEGISAEWLLTGEGSMLKGEREPQPVSEPPTAEPEVVEVLRQQLAEKDRQIAEKDRQLAERDKQTGILLRMLSA